MFDQVNAPVLGLIENMSYHLCPGCGHRSEIFSHGGGIKMAEELDIPLLGEIPLVRAIREGSDRGQPIVITNPEGPEKCGVSCHSPPHHGAVGTANGRRVANRSLNGEQ